MPKKPPARKCLETPTWYVHAPAKTPDWRKPHEQCNTGPVGTPLVCPLSYGGGSHASKLGSFG